jgi:hypothetical protein
MTVMDTKPNRLGISHLFLWMTTTAVVLAVGQWDLNTANLHESLAAQVRLHSFLWSLTFGPLQGVALAGVLVFVWRRLWSRVAFPAEPGHWILIISGAERLAHLTAKVAYLSAIRGHESEVPNWASQLTRYSLNGFTILLAVIGACHACGGRVWRLTILAMGLLGATTIFHSLASQWLPAMRPFLSGELWMFLLRFGYSLPGLLALVAVFIDWRHKQRRDFFHWCGMTLIVVGPMVEWAHASPLNR